MPATGEPPSAHWGHTAVWAAWSGQERLIVWGGFDNSGNALDNGAVFDPSTQSWTAMAPTWTPRGPRPVAAGSPFGRGLCLGQRRRRRPQARLGRHGLPRPDDLHGRYLVALLPHGRPTDPGGGPARGRVHRLAIAFFELAGPEQPDWPPDGRLVDRCETGDNLSWGVDVVGEGSGDECNRVLAVQTTEPSWLIDVPELAMPGESVRPPMWLAGHGPDDWVSRTAHAAADPRLFDADFRGYRGWDGDPAERPEHIFLHHDNGMMPAPAELLVDVDHERGYVFANRWYDHRSLDLPFADTAAGAPVLISFSLAPPAGAGDPDPTVCSRNPEFTHDDPFDGLYATEATAAVQIATGLEVTAAVEPIVLARGPERPIEAEELRPFDPSALATAAIPYRPVALDAQRQLLLITQTGAGTVLVFDGADLTRAPNTIATGAAPVSVAVDRHGRAFVVNRDDETLSVIDLDSLAKVRDVPVGLMPVNLYVDTARPGSSDTLVYVLNLLSDNITLYDPAGDRVEVAPVPPSCHGPAEMVVDEHERVAAVMCKTHVYYDGRATPTYSYSFSLVHDGYTR